jgi:hypothetical protein
MWLFDRFRKKKELKMDHKDKCLLDLSIRKWEKRKYNRHYYEKCPLCTLYARGNICTGCPVMRKTGRNRCYGTPFYDIKTYHYNWKRYCQDEIDFLETCYY